jgi:hypothetical protein
VIDPDAVLNLLELAHNVAQQADAKTGAQHSATRPLNSSMALIDRRRDPRFPTVRSVSVVPILPDFRLDLSWRAAGEVIDISASGIGVRLESVPSTIARSLLLGVGMPDGRLQYTAVEVCRIDSVGPNAKRVGARFGETGNRLLQSPVLTPIFDPKKMQYRFPIPEGALRDWVEAGVLSPRLLDRVLVCPRCETLPTFRHACRACKSARIDRERLIHHYACGHVDRIDAYRLGDELRCPKCLRRNLVVGADFDFQQGPVVCADCRWRDSDAAYVGHCLRCGFRFVAEEAKEQQLVGYDAQRLDVLALLPAS